MTTESHKTRETIKQEQGQQPVLALVLALNTIYLNVSVIMHLASDIEETVAVNTTNKDVVSLVSQLAKAVQEAAQNIREENRNIYQTLLKVKDS